MIDKLTVEQSIKADDFLRKLSSEGNLQREAVHSFFGDKDEAIFICTILSKKNLVKLLSPSDSHPFGVISEKDGVSILLKNGGLAKIAIDLENEKNKILEREAKNDKILDLDLRLKSFETKIGNKIIVAGFIIAFLSFLITILTLVFWNAADNISKKEPQATIQELHRK